MSILSVSAITRRTFTGLAVGGAALVAAPRIMRAAFPERTIRIMVGFGAGGTVDTIARIVAQAIEPILGQSVIVENRPGGIGSIAANAVVQAPSDGHTLLLGVFSHAVAPALMTLNYDTIKDLTAVSQVASVPLFLFASEKSPYHSVADVVAAARQSPKQSPMPPAASAPLPISAPSCSRARSASSSCTCRIAAARRRCNRCSRARSS